MLIELDRTGVLHEQIYSALQLKILAGELREGMKVLSSRELAKQLRVSRNVVLGAYSKLMAEGYIVSRTGSGTYIGAIPDEYLASKTGQRSRVIHLDTPPRLSDYAKRLGDRIPEPPYRVGLPRSTARYDFRHGHPACDVLAQRSWRRIIARRAGRVSREETSYAPPEGVRALREAVAEYLRTHRGVECDANQIVIVNGSQQALDLVTRILINPGDSVVVEEPCYPGMRQALVGLGAMVRAIPVDQQGLVTDDLHSIRPAPRLICVTPSHQYPTGSVMPLARRLALIAYARRVGAYILEDDYDSEFRYDARPERSVQGLEGGERVIYVSTFSKVLYPALRLGYVALPTALIEPFVVAKSVSDRYSATLMQGVIAEFIRGGDFERHIRRVRVEVSERRRATIDALQAHFQDRVRIVGEDAGVHLLAWFPAVRHEDLPHLCDCALKQDVGVHPVDPCFAKQPKVTGLVMGYASMTPEDIREGIGRFARVFNGAAAVRPRALVG